MPRKLIVSIHRTANDIVTGPPSDETNFMVWAQAGIEDAIEPFLKSLANFETMLLGRGTYEDLSRKWPKVKEWPDTTPAVLGIADKINNSKKFVVASERSPEKLPWGEFEPATRLIGSRMEEQIKALKKGEGGEIMTFGSPTLVQSLANAGLVDEYRLIVHPVIVNEGRRLFENLKGRTDFRLVSVETLKRGTMMVTYASQPAG
jgi:dihydrofolate reductase